MFFVGQYGLSENTKSEADQFLFLESDSLLSVEHCRLSHAQFEIMVQNEFTTNSENILVHPNERSPSRLHQ